MNEHITYKSSERKIMNQAVSVIVIAISELTRMTRLIWQSVTAVSCHKALITLLTSSKNYLYTDWLGLGKCVRSYWSSTSWGLDSAGLTSSSPRRLRRILWLAEAEGSLPAGTTLGRPETPCWSHTLSASESESPLGVIIITVDTPRK